MTQIYAERIHNFYELYVIKSRIDVFESILFGLGSLFGKMLLSNTSMHRKKNKSLILKRYAY